MDLFISDTHFGHENAVRFDPRPFRDAEEMFSVMKMRWNEKVRDADDVWILGDVSLDKSHDAGYYISQLKGRKHLIYGNHDRAIIRSPKIQSMFEECCHLRYLESEGRVLFLSHYPIADWYKSHHGSYHIYGHIHADRGEVFKFMSDGVRGEHAFNAGCMINGYVPVTFDELRANNLRFRQNASDHNDQGE